MSKYFKNILIYFLIGFFTLITVNKKYHFGDNNHIEHLPQIYAQLDKNYLNNDFFTNYSRSNHPRQYYIKLVSLISKKITPEKTFYILTLLSNFFIFTATHHLISIINPNIIISAISIYILSILSNNFNLGSAAFITDFYLTPQLLVTPLVFYAYLFNILKMYKITTLLLLVILMIHPTIGLLTTIFIIPNILLKKKYKITALTLILIGLFTYIFYLSNSTTNILDKHTYINILAYFRHPHHYIPSKFSPKHYIQFLTMLFFVINSILIHILYFKNKIIKTEILLSIYTMLLILVSGYVFVEIIPIKSVVKIQPFRVIFLFNWISIITITTTLSNIRPNKKTILIPVIISYVFLIENNNKDLFNKIITNPKIYITENTNKKKLYDYINDNTPENAVFLTPPNFGDIRIIPKRAIVIDWKSFMFEEDAMSEWYSRIVECYGKTNFEDNYKNLSDNKILDLKKKYNFNYTILYSNTSTNLNAIYSDDLYKIVKM